MTNKYKVWDKEEGQWGFFNNRDEAKGFIKGLIEADGYYRRFYKVSDFSIIKEKEE